MKRSPGSYPKHRGRLLEILDHIKEDREIVPLNLVKNFIQVLRDLPGRLREPSLTWYSRKKGESPRLCITVGYGHFNKWEAEFYQTPDGEIWCRYKVDQDHWTRAEGTDRVLEFTKLPYVLELLSETHCLWTEEEEGRYIAERKASLEKFRARMDRECAGMSPMERMGHVLASPLRREMLYDSVSRGMLSTARLVE